MIDFLFKILMLGIVATVAVIAWPSRDERLGRFHQATSLTLFGVLALALVKLIDLLSSLSSDPRYAQWFATPQAELTAKAIVTAIVAVCAAGFLHWLTRGKKLTWFNGIEGREHVEPDGHDLARSAAPTMLHRKTAAPTDTPGTSEASNDEAVEVLGRLLEELDADPHTLLALSVVCQFVRQSNGDIRVHGDKRGGTSIELHLPGTTAVRPCGCCQSDQSHSAPTLESAAPRVADVGEGNPEPTNGHSTQQQSTSSRLLS